MAMINIVIVGLVSFVTVALKGFQQKNVIKGKTRAMFITSYFMALGDIFLVKSIVTSGFEIFVAVGTGSAIGMLVSVTLHDKLYKS